MDDRSNLNILESVFCMARNLNVASKYIVLQLVSIVVELSTWPRTSKTASFPGVQDILQNEQWPCLRARKVFARIRELRCDYNSCSSESSYKRWKALSKCRTRWMVQRELAPWSCVDGPAAADARDLQRRSKRCSTPRHAELGGAFIKLGPLARRTRS